MVGSAGVCELEGGRIAIKNYEDPAICARCGGKCCKLIPGICLPEDFGEPLFDNLLKALKTGNYAVDWWEGDPRDDTPEMDSSEYIWRGYFIRPATRRAKLAGILFDPSWGGECVFLAEHGCKLPLEMRPHQCRTLEPRKDGNCISHGGDKRKYALAWLPYYNKIEEIER